MLEVFLHSIMRESFCTVNYIYLKLLCIYITKESNF